MRAATRMTEHVQAYLSLRRTFGFNLNIAGQLLRAFALFADREAADKPFTVELALRWAQSSSTGKQVTAARRLLILQPFARYLRSIEPLTEVLPNRLLGPAQYRYIPHVYTDAEIRALLGAATDLRPRSGLRPQSVLTYLGLLACTGMRPREPLRLTRADVDLQANVLAVRQTKFSKSRIVIVDPTAARALREYASLRDGRVSSPQSTAFFLSDDGSALTYKKALWLFSFCAVSWAGSTNRAVSFLVFTIFATALFAAAFWHGTRTVSTFRWRCHRCRLIWDTSRSPIRIGM